MSDKRRFGGGYRLFSRLLARKGSAEPLPVEGERLILSCDDDVEPANDEQLAEAVIESTLEAMAADPQRRRTPRAAARLTELLDPTLIDVARRHR